MAHRLVLHELVTDHRIQVAFVGMEARPAIGVLHKQLGKNALKPSTSSVLCPAIMLTRPPPPADRFALFIFGLCQLVVARGPARGVAAPILAAIRDRLSRLTIRFCVLALRLQSRRRSYQGTRRHICERQDSPASPSCSPNPENPSRRRMGKRSPRLPNYFGWLLDLVPDAAEFCGALEVLLSDPEFTALRLDFPQVLRALHYLGQMLGIPIPDSTPFTPATPRPLPPSSASLPAPVIEAQPPPSFIPYSKRYLLT